MSIATPPSQFGKLISVKDITMPALWEMLDEQRRNRFIRKRERSAPKLAYHHPDMGDDPEQDPLAAANLELLQKIAPMIEFHYPGHPWKIETDIRQGILTIELPPLMTKPACGIVRLIELHTDPGFKTVMRVCGQILERFRLPRNKYDHGDFHAACRKRDVIDARRGIVPE